MWWLVLAFIFIIMALSCIASIEGGDNDVK